MKKRLICIVYWLMNVVRLFIMTPIFVCKYLVCLIHYIFELGFCFNLYNSDKTYTPLKKSIEEIQEDELYIIIFFVVVLPCFFVAIPAFILRHIYLTWKYVEELYFQECKK